MRFQPTPQTYTMAAINTPNPPAPPPVAPLAGPSVGSNYFQGVTLQALVDEATALHNLRQFASIRQDAFFKAVAAL